MSPNVSTTTIWARGRGVAAALVLLALSSCAGGEDAPPAVPARIELAPNAVLLTEPGATKTVAAKVYDAQGNTIEAAVEWTSSRPGQIAVNTAGLLTATGSGGSAQIIARIGSVQSPPLLAVHTEVPAGALLLTDANIVGEPEEVTPDAEASVTNTYRVRLTGVPAPAAGALVINTEGKIVGGRVQAVSSDGDQHQVTLGLVSAPELFPTLNIDEDIDLNFAEVVIPDELLEIYDLARSGNTYTFTPKAGTTAAGLAEGHTPSTGIRGSGQRASGTRALPPFTSCEAMLVGGAGSGLLPVGLSVPPLFTITLNNRLEVLYSSVHGLERFVVHGAPNISVTGGLKATVAFEGKVTCEIELAIIRIPVGGPLSLILGGLVPIGVGVELSGKVVLASMALTAKATVATTFDVGIACPEGDNCELVKNFGERTFTFTPTLDAPGLGDLRLEPSLSAFGFAKASIGNPLLKSLRFNALSVKAGVAIRGSFAPRGTQIADPLYKSDYKLVGELKAGAGAELSGLAALLGLRSLAAVELVLAVDLATSPRGTVTADKGEFVTDDTVTFNVKLDPTTVDALPVIGPYNVKRIVLVRDTDPLTPLEVASLPASDRQTEFNFPFTARGAGRADEFYAFVVTTLLPLDLLALELGRASATMIEPGALSGSLSLRSTLISRRTRVGSTEETVSSFEVSAPVSYDSAQGSLVLLSFGLLASEVRTSSSVVEVDRSPCVFDSVTDTVARKTIVAGGPDPAFVGFSLSDDAWILGRPEFPVTTQVTTTTRRSTANVRGDCTGFDLGSTTETAEDPARSASFDPDLSITRRPAFQGTLSRDAQGRRSLAFADTLMEEVQGADFFQSADTSVQLTLTE